MSRAPRVLHRAAPGAVLCRLGLVALALLGAPAAIPAPAWAQAGMPDPSAMSGIPRPDPKVPAGTITVRLIRGSFANPLPGTEVELWTLPATGGPAPRKEKTDAAGRATFAGLPAGAYEARAVVEAEALASQPIELTEQPGIAVMLVFSQSIEEQQKELGKADGKARVSLELPPGTLLVRAVDEKGTGLADLRVTLSHGDRATEKVDALPEQKTDAQGQARFTALKTGAGDGYLVSVFREGTACRGKPFRLVANHGSLVSIECRKASKDLSQLRIGAASHIILELEDDTVQAIENLRLQNQSEQPLDPGPAGLRIPLPEGALSPQLVPMQEGQAPPVTIDVSRAGEAPVALWKGPVPPGDTDLRVAFILKHRGTLRFRQATPVAFEVVRVIAEKSPEMKLEGPGLETEERKWQGRDLLLATAQPPAAGGAIEFSVSGLPYHAPVGRYLAAVVALAVLLGFGLVARRAPQPQEAQARRESLERRRRELLEQLAQGGAAGKRKGKGKGEEALLGELEQVYRDIDELGGAA